MIKCKRCQSTNYTKNGTVRNKPRYKCKDCSHNFTEGDARVKEDLVKKKALAVILYSLGKASFGFLGKLFGVSRSLAYRWIKEESERISEPEISNEIKEIEFDEMWHFIRSKKTKNGSSKRWIVVQGELLPGLQAVVMLQPSKDFTTKSNT
jgi:transposase